MIDGRKCIFFIAKCDLKSRKYSGGLALALDPRQLGASSGQPLLGSLAIKTVLPAGIMSYRTTVQGADYRPASTCTHYVYLESTI